MTFERRQTAPLLTYEAWKVLFRQDCESEGKLRVFELFGDDTLKLLWEMGLAPTVRAVVGTTEDGKTTP